MAPDLGQRGLAKPAHPRGAPARRGAVVWERDLDYALRRAKSGGLPVLLYFRDADSVACKALDEETFADESVAETLVVQAIPALLPHDHIPLSAEYGVTWSPSLLVLDPEGRAHRRDVGFLPPEEFTPFLLLGCAGVYFDGDKFDHAAPLLETLLRLHAGSAHAPEARYLLGMTAYKSDGDASHLRLAFEDLARRWPRSLWTAKARPYAAL